VNKLTRMIDQSHRLHLGEARAVASADEADAQAVAGRSGGLFQNDVEAAVVLAGQSWCGALGSAGAQGFQKRAQGGWQGHGVKFARIGVLPLGVTHVKNVALEVDLGEGHGCLGKTASGSHHDLEHMAHPCGTLGKARAASGEQMGGEVGFYFDRSEADLGQGNDVAFDILSAHGLVEQEGKELGLHARGILPDPLRLAPLHELLGVLVANLARVGQALFGKESGEVGPRNLGTAAGRGPIVVVGEVVRHPAGEVAGVFGAENQLLLLLARLVGQAAGGLGVGGDGMTQAGGAIAPIAGLRIAAAQYPIRGFFGFFKRGHLANRAVPHGSPYRGEFAKVPHGIKWTNSVKRWFQEAYHYTTSQSKYLRNQALTKWFPMGSPWDESFCKRGMKWSVVPCGGLSKGKGALV